MPAPFDQKLDEIAAACQRYVIERLFVFGSALRDNFRPGQSDIYLLVEFGPLEVTKRLHIYLDAREAIRNVFQSDVDLVMKGAVKNTVIASEILITQLAPRTAMRAPRLIHQYHSDHGTQRHSVPEGAFLP